MQRTRLARAGALGAALVVAVTAAACGDSDSTETSATTVAPAPRIAVSDAWCRTSPMTAEAGACYLEISNTGGEADMLVGASVPTTVAATAEVHETVSADGQEPMAGDEMAGTDTTMAGGMMEMREVHSIEVPAGGMVTLEPGGYHIMLQQLVAPLEEGAVIELRLDFAVSGSQTVQATVRP